MKNLTLLIVIIIFTSVNCLNKNGVETINFPSEMQRIIDKSVNEKRFFIYYHSGNCSICYITLMNLSHKFPDIPLISISASPDTALVNFYLQSINFKGVSLIDYDSAFFRVNSKTLKYENLFLLDSANTIIESGRKIKIKQ